jgi:hypothetical protein
VTTETQSDRPGEDQDHRGAYGGGQVGIDMGDAHLGEQSCCRGEKSREDGPSKPIHENAIGIVYFRIV